MKPTAIVPVLLLVSSYCQAGDGWVLVDADGDDALIRVSGSSATQVENLGDVTLYGFSPNRIVVLTHRKVRNTGELIVLDRRTNALETRLPVDSYPASQLSGMTEDVAVIADDVYFVSVRYSANLKTVERNSRGGYFDLNRLSLKDGKSETWPFPREMANPRLGAVNGRVMTFGDTRRYTLDEAARSVVLTSVDLPVQPDHTAPPCADAVAPEGLLCADLPDRALRRVTSTGHASTVIELTPVLEKRRAWQIVVLTPL
jgi:hypothetical protein